MLSSKPKGTNINFVADKGDRERLERVSRRLALSKSEVARRSLRLGLDRFEKISLPGSSESDHAQ